eukprot:350981-Chlamydomonas_euryale.AAC.1
MAPFTAAAHLLCVTHGTMSLNNGRHALQPAPLGCTRNMRLDGTYVESTEAMPESRLMLAVHVQLKSALGSRQHPGKA